MLELTKQEKWKFTYKVKRALMKNKLLSEIKNVFKTKSKFVSFLIYNIPEPLEPNIREWLNGQPLSEIRVSGNRLFPHTESQEDLAECMKLFDGLDFGSIESSGFSISDLLGIWDNDFIMVVTLMTLWYHYTILGIDMLSKQRFMEFWTAPI